MRGPFFSLASQAVGVAQLALLLIRAGANQATDAYYYLFSIGMLPIQIILVGVMYPLLLNEERITRKALLRIRRWTPVLSIAIMAGGIGFLALNDRLGFSMWPIAAGSLANAFVQSHLWFRAVTAEAGGEPRWIAGIALPANLAAALVLLVPWTDPVSAVTAMLCALIVGNIVALAFAARRKVGDHVVGSAPQTRTASASRTGGAWFFSKATVGYVGLTVLQSLAILLPASSLTLLNIAAKLVGSVSSTFVNAVMPGLVHQNTETQDGARKFLRLLLTLSILGSVILTVAVGIYDSALLPVAASVGLWVIATSAAAVAQRMAFRFLPPSASRITIVVIPVVIVLALLSSAAPGFELVVLLCSYALLDAANSAILLVSLRDRLASAVMIGIALALSALWIATLFDFI